MGVRLRHQDPVMRGPKAESNQGCRGCRQALGGNPGPHAARSTGWGLPAGLSVLVLHGSRILAAAAAGRENPGPVYDRFMIWLQGS